MTAFRDDGLLSKYFAIFTATNLVLENANNKPHKIVFLDRIIT